MTKFARPHILLTANYENQEDVCALKPSSQPAKHQESMQRIQMTDGNNDAEPPVVTRDPGAPTSLEGLLDLEFDSIIASSPVSDQMRANTQKREKMEARVDFVSLELLVSTVSSAFSVIYQ